MSPVALIFNMSSTEMKIYVGTELGTLKKFYNASNNLENLLLPQIDQSRNSIIYVKWADKCLKKIILLYSNGDICIYNLLTKISKKIGCLKSSSINGFELYKKHFICTTKDGYIRIYNRLCKLKLEMKYNNISCLQKCSKPRWLLAFGGKENDLKIFNINKLISKNIKPFFQAKNVSNDNLDMHMPIWITGISFLKDTNKVAVCTAYHQIKVYGIPVSGKSQLSTNRPIIILDIGENPFTTLCYVSTNNTLLAGDSKGFLAIINFKQAINESNKFISPSDLPYKKYEKIISHQYIAKKVYVHCSNGAITNILSTSSYNAEQEIQNFIIILSRDKYLRLYLIGQLKSPLQQIYLKSTPLCALIAYNPGSENQDTLSTLE